MIEDFFDWLYYGDAPDWAVTVAATLFACIILALMLATIASLIRGLWVVPVIIWFVAPSYLLIRAYADRNKDGDQ